MAGLDDLAELFGQPPAREPSPEDWTEVEDYVRSALPSDFKAFLDTYGTGVICGELVIFHPRGSSPLLTRMRKIHESFGQWWRRDSDEYPFRFHPDAGGLISWGYDYSGDEHFFWPCDPEPDRWKVVTNINGTEPEVFDGGRARRDRSGQPELRAVLIWLLGGVCRARSSGGTFQQFVAVC
ncbi:MAG: hypothetical protein QOF84_6904 [Streptomyces sp.]|nr:hypothetical protein [Streptomyces sp.]